MAGHLCYEAFLERHWDNSFVEWVQGVAIEMEPVTSVENELGGWLLSAIGTIVEEREVGEMFYAPFQMRTGPDRPGRAPDLMFVRKENLWRLHRMYLEGPADMVVEIISPGSERVDRGDKFYEYEKGGVREYWLIDPQRRSAEFYRLDAGGVFRAVPPDTEGVFRSEVLPQLWLKVEWLWRDTQPPALQVLKEWGIV